MSLGASALKLRDVDDRGSSAGAAEVINRVSEQARQFKAEPSPEGSYSAKAQLLQAERERSWQARKLREFLKENFSIRDLSEGDRNAKVLYSPLIPLKVIPDSIWAELASRDVGSRVLIYAYALDASIPWPQQMKREVLFVGVVLGVKGFAEDVLVVSLPRELNLSKVWVDVSYELGQGLDVKMFNESAKGDYFSEYRRIDWGERIPVGSLELTYGILLEHIERLKQRREEVEREILSRKQKQIERAQRERAKAGMLANVLSQIQSS